MRRRYIWSNQKDKFVEIDRNVSAVAPYTVGDLEDFRSSDGKHISGRAKWREHLKATGAVEMGHADLSAAHDKWESKKSDEAEKLKRAPKLGVSDVPVTGEIEERRRTRIDAEVANRLHNRPLPDRVTLIRMALEESKRR